MSEYSAVFQAHCGNDLLNQYGEQPWQPQQVMRGAVEDEDPVQL